MDNIIASTLLPGVPVSSGAKPLTALPENLPPELKPGDTFLLQVIEESVIFKSGDLFKLALPPELGGQTLNLRLQAPLRLDGDNSAVRQFQARVMNDGSLQLQVVPSKPEAPAAVKLPIINQAADKLPNITFRPLKLEPVLDKLMSEEKFPPSLKTFVSENLPPAEVIIGLKSVAQMPPADNQILAPLKTVLSQMLPLADKLQQLAPLVQELSVRISELNGQTLPAWPLPDQPQEHAVLLETPLGRVWTEQPLKLPADATLQLEILQTVAKPQIEELPLLKNVVEILAKWLPQGEVRLHPEAIVQALRKNDEPLAQLLKVFEPLVESRPQLAAAVLQKLPGLKTDMLQNMYSFYQAAKQGNAAKWLGPELITRISAEAPRAAETLSGLDSLVNNAVRETPLWRVIEFPFFDGSQMLPLRLAVKKDTENERRTAGTKSGLRFMINTEFSKLGAFQFDGLSVAAERRFDLLIRTEKTQDKDFCSAIMNLFKKSLHDLDYIGSIKINQREAFIKVEPAVEPGEGVYV